MPTIYAVAPEAEGRSAALRVAVLSTGLSQGDLRAASREQLLQLQGQLCLGSTWGLLEVPMEFMSRRALTPGSRCYSIKNSVPAAADESGELATRIWTELLRLALAMRLFPGRHGGQLKYTVILKSLEVSGRVTRYLYDRLGNAGFWSLVSHEEIERIGKSKGRTHVKLLTHYFVQGCLPDGPSLRPKPCGDEPARDRSGEPEHSCDADTSRMIQPYPDVYIGEAGWRASRLIKDVGPALLDLLESIAVGHEDGSASAQPKLFELSSKNDARSQTGALDELVRTWTWRDRTGSQFLDLGFPVRFGRSRKSRQRSAFPPASFAEAWNLLNLVQGSHLFVVALAAGPRHGELLSMEGGCIVEAEGSTSRATFWTWKLEAVGGRGTDAPIPEIVVLAIRQQERLANVVRALYGICGNHLWVQLGRSRGEPLKSLSGTLAAFHRDLELAQFLPDNAPSAHRFRKTLARIVALALVHAPKILMDVFGHRDEQMTVLRYILADPGLLTEIQIVVRELIVLKGVEAATNSQQVEGRGAPRLREAVRAHAARLGAAAVEPQNVLEFARAMTEDGTGWAVIAPGIVCTGFKTGGVCNKHQRGGANPHYCHPSCEKQLIFPGDCVDGKVTAEVVRVIETIQWTLEQINYAENEEDQMLVAQFSGQVRTLLNRWREVDAHFAQDIHFSRLFPDVVLLP